ncbi:MAG: F0F1 ATP synthase subunit gamma, partial [Eubacteriales bacterium]
RRSAERYNAMQEELEAMMEIVLQNRNLKLDKAVKLPDPNLPPLRIYIGSDYGFCGGVNSTVSGILAHDENCDKIVIGKKLRNSGEALLVMTQEEYTTKPQMVYEYLVRAVKERCWSAVDVVYTHFYNISSIKQESRRIYPMEEKATKQEDVWLDFNVEGDVVKLLENLTIAYLDYEIKIAVASAFASENVMRQNATSESLKKLDEMEEEAIRKDRKEKNRRTFQKTIDSFVKQKSLEQSSER